MAELEIYESALGGDEIPFVAADPAGDTVDHFKDLAVFVRNGGAATRTVTFAATKPCNQGVLHHLVVAIPAGEERFVGPFPDWFINDQGFVSWTYDDAADVTLAPIRVV